ncbi:MAG: glutathione S-transferase [Telmatospirillum sp.]|nr:glutathione S-transferase [Telmatospirillum sp.]
MLTVLGKLPSINVRKVLWTAGEIGLAYEREDWGLGFASTRSADFLALNPNGQVPVVRTEDGVLWESNSICRYLAHRQGRHDLLPADAWGRARVERWMDWQATDLNGAWRYAFLGLARRNPAFQDRAAIGDSLRAWTGKMEILDRQLAATGAFVAGNAFTLADVVIGLSVNRWLKTPVERPALPAVAAYFARLSLRPAFREHAHPEEV